MTEAEGDGSGRELDALVAAAQGTEGGFSEPAYGAGGVVMWRNGGGGSAGQGADDAVTVARTDHVPPPPPSTPSKDPHSRRLGRLG